MNKEKIIDKICTVVGFLIGVFMIANPICWICIYNLRTLSKRKGEIMVMNAIKLIKERYTNIPNIYIAQLIPEVGRTNIGLKKLEAELCSKLIYKGTNTETNVELNIDRLVSLSLGITPIFKLLLTSTIVHELTHVQQYTDDKNAFNGYVHGFASYKNYKNQPVEIEARKAGKDFCKKNFIKIIRA